MITFAAGFGIVHNSGMLTKWLGPPDGNDHATAVLIAGGSTVGARNVTVQATIVGDDLQVRAAELEIAAFTATSILS